MGNFVPEQLEKAAELYRQRNKLYGQNYKLFGNVMAEMFPDGLTINSAADWNRIGVFVQIMSKITRYSANYDNGGHADSLLDNSVYSCILAELDSEQLPDKELPPKWVHCSPELLECGVSCECTARRPCECWPEGSHDHYVQFCSVCRTPSTGTRCPKHFSTQGL